MNTPSARRSAATAATHTASAIAGSSLLGGLTPEIFLRDYWQKKPLLIRAAIPGFGDALDRKQLLELAARDDVESRYVAHDTKSWQLANGPFTKTAARRWNGRWTVLVQGVNLVLPAGDDLLKKFSFIPHARLDDLMVSYATDGAGVGPHVDNYDVFLLQGSGRRRWRIGKQTDMRLIDDAPLKILRNFKPEFDWILEPGDMLYLPPEWAHDGTAVGECMTWSIGFRTSPARELAEQFLGVLQDHIAENQALQGRYADPDLRVQKHPAEISEAMITQVSTLLKAIQWNDAVVRDFLGVTLSEPKPHVYFDTPDTELSSAAFLSLAKKSGVRLDARSRMLFGHAHFYLNGEMLQPEAELHEALRTLADQRHLPAGAFAGLTRQHPLVVELHDWYQCGYLQLGD